MVVELKSTTTPKKPKKVGFNGDPKRVYVLLPRFNLTQMCGWVGFGRTEDLLSYVALLGGWIQA